MCDVFVGAHVVGCRRQEYLKRKKNTASREDDVRASRNACAKLTIVQTLARLASFKQVIQKAHTGPAPSAPARQQPAKEAAEGINFVEDEVVGDSGWMQHKVKFSKRPQDYDPMARDQSAYATSVLS